MIVLYEAKISILWHHKKLRISFLTNTFTRLLTLKNKRYFIFIFNFFNTLIYNKTKNKIKVFNTKIF